MDTHEIINWASDHFFSELNNMTATIRCRSKSLNQGFGKVSVTFSLKVWIQPLSFTCKIHNRFYHDDFAKWFTSSLSLSTEVYSLPSHLNGNAAQSPRIFPLHCISSFLFHFSLCQHQHRRYTLLPRDLRAMRTFPRSPSYFEHEHMSTNAPQNS